MITIDKWNELNNIIQNKIVGDCETKRYIIRKNNSMAYKYNIPDGEYVKLLISGEVMMSTTPMEYYTNREFMNKAHGDILIGGLGLGCVPYCIQDKKEVKSITVIEYSQNIIDLVLPQHSFNDKVKVVKDDVFTFKPEKKYNCIYMDIWAFINSDVYEEMKKLKRKYGQYLVSKEEDPERYNDTWCNYEAKHDMRI